MNRNKDDDGNYYYYWIPRAILFSRIILFHFFHFLVRCHFREKLSFFFFLILAYLNMFDVTMMMMMMMTNRDAINSGNDIYFFQFRNVWMWMIRIMIKFIRKWWWWWWTALMFVLKINKKRNADCSLYCQL